MDITLERILKLKKDKGITDTQFQKDIGVYSTALAEWKNGKTTSYLKKLPKIAEYFNVPVDYLLGNTNTKERPHTENGMEPKEKLLLEKFRQLTPEMQEFVLSSVQAQSDKLKKEQNQ